ncbi:GHKL domain-containing protein [bacterium]|nr:GHKL domain-containing protein [bacterium]
MSHSNLHRWLNPALIIIIALVMGGFMVLLSVIEMQYGQKLIRDLVFEKGIVLLDQIEQSGSLAVRAGEQVEHELEERLLTAALAVAQLEHSQTIDQLTLQALATQFRLKTVHLVGANGKIEMTNQPADHFDSMTGGDFQAMFSDLFAGTTEKMVVGLHMSSNQEGLRYSAAVRRLRAGIVVVSIDAAVLTKFRRSFGLGRLVRDAATLPGVQYVVIQDKMGIVASSSGVQELLAIEADPFLEQVLSSGQAHFRESRFEGDEVFEVVRAMNVSPLLSGLVRIAFGAREIRTLEHKSNRRLLVTFLVLFSILTLATYSLVIYHNLSVTRQARDEIANLSDAILRDMADAVLVVEPDRRIKLFNQQAQILCGGQLETLPDSLVAIYDRLVQSSINQVTGIDMLDRNGLMRTIIVSASTLSFSEETGPLTVFLCHDITEEQKLQRQVRENEKTVAMGKLAAAVAHEIRNPLNAIGMAVQRLKTIVTTPSGHDHATNLLNIVSEEIGRLDGIITQFLKFARAPVIAPQRADLARTVQRAVDEIKTLAQSHGITVTSTGPAECLLDFDEQQLFQVCLNVLTNAVDACHEQGAPGPHQIRVTIVETDLKVAIRISDTGRGMDKAELDRVFDLYYTTKDRGTGLGLPIALNIVQAHHGTLEIDSEVNRGTTVTITLSRGTTDHEG